CRTRGGRCPKGKRQQQKHGSQWCSSRWFRPMAIPVLFARHGCPDSKARANQSLECFQRAQTLAPEKGSPHTVPEKEQALAARRFNRLHACWFSLVRMKGARDSRSAQQSGRTFRVGRCSRE